MSATFTSSAPVRGRLGLALLSVLGIAPAVGFADPVGPGRSQTLEEGAEAADELPALPPDEAVEPYRLELLDTAFAAVSGLPLNPHIRNRARGQEEVVQAALAIGLPQRALAYAEEIPNWRRGAGYADLAFYCAEREHLGPMEYLLARALEVADTDDDWRRDRIRTKVARTHSLLGDSLLAAHLSAGAADSEAGRALVVEASLAEEEDIDRHLDYLRAVSEAQSFDLALHALEANVALFDRFYDDEEQRTRIEEAIVANWGRSPFDVRVDNLLAMSRIAAEHGDPEHSSDLVDQAQALVDGVTWQMQHEVPLRAKLLVARGWSGEPARARAEADVALSLYEAGREDLGSGFRARTLRPLAEALVEIGDREAGLKLFARTVEEGAVNPNSRPRAFDLSATCCAMARLAVGPDAALRARIAELLEGLGDPW